jgi:transcriptional regulator with XRE-family HTH domain
MPQTPATALGRFIREQRQTAQLSLREMARMTDISNAYLSQIERGLHEPSVRVLHALADALEVPVEDLLNGGDSGESRRRHNVSVEAAIRNDPKLEQVQKDALLAVYRSYVPSP